MTMMTIEWILGGIAAVCALWLIGRYRHNSLGVKPYILADVFVFLLGIACVVGIIKLDAVRLDALSDERTLLRNSEYLAEIMDRTGILKDEPDAVEITSEAVYAGSDYLLLNLYESDGEIQLSQVRYGTKNDTLTEELIESYPTLGFCLCDNWATKSYTVTSSAGTGKTTGTSEHVRLYLYDAETKTVFAVEDFYADPLPSTAITTPNYDVKLSALQAFIKEHSV